MLKVYLLVVLCEGVDFVHGFICRGLYRLAITRAVARSLQLVTSVNLRTS